MPPAIQCVLFDFGGVFMDSPFDAVRAVGDALPIGGGRLLQYVFGPYDEDTDHPWHRLERGEIDLLTAREGIRELAARDGEDVDLFETLGSLSRAAIRPPMVDVATAARAVGCRVGLVTNNVREFGDSWRQMLPVDALFDVVVDSHEEGVRKPDPRIFARALERLGNPPPAATVFLDDFDGNVRAAERLGLRGILVGPRWEDAIVTLRGLLG